MKKNEIFKTIVALACFASFGFAPEWAMALPAHHNVISPFLAAGEREIEMNIGTRKQNNTDGSTKVPDSSSATLGYGYAFTNYFKSEIELEFASSDALQAIDGSALRVADIEWENHLMFSDRGEYFIDPGIFFEIERSMDRSDGERYTLIYGGLFRKDFGLLEMQFNPLFARNVGRKTAATTNATFRYQYQAKYRFLQTLNQSTLSAGFQALGDLGEWNNWNPRQDQEHRIGPAIFYKWRTGYNRNAWNGSIAYLFDLTARNWGSVDRFNQPSRSMGETLRLMVEWEF